MEEVQMTNVPYRKIRQWNSDQYRNINFRWRTFVTCQPEKQKKKIKIGLLGTENSSHKSDDRQLY